MIDAEAGPPEAGHNGQETGRSAAAEEALRSLGCTIAALAPGRQQVALTDKERERLALLRRAAEHVAALPRPRPGPGQKPAPEGDADLVLLAEAHRLRALAAATLAALGQHAAAEMRAGIEKALLHWDQAGDLRLLSAEGRERSLRLHEAAREALAGVLKARRRTPEILALLLCAVEAMTAVDAACTLLRSVEVRFVPLVRERLRQRIGPAPAGPPPEQEEREALLPGGAPFVDPGQAVLLTARAFGWPGGGGGADQGPEEEAHAA